MLPAPPPIVAAGKLAPLAVLMACFALPAQAQVNTESLSMGAPSEGFAGDAKADLALKHGNVDLLQLGGSGRVLYHHDVHTPLFYVRGEHGKLGGERYQENLFAHARWTAMWHPRVGSELFAQLQHDAFVRLRFRALIGAGPRVALLLEDWIELYLGTGYMLEREVLSIPATDPHPKRTLNHRSTSYASLKIALAERLSLRNVIYVQPRFDRFEDVRVLDELELEVRAADYLSIVNSVVMRHDSEPPGGVEKLDISLTFGLRVSSEAD